MHFSFVKNMKNAHFASSCAPSPPRPFSAVAALTSLPLLISWVSLSPLRLCFTLPSPSGGASRPSPVPLSSPFWLSSLPHWFYGNQLLCSPRECARYGCRCACALRGARTPPPPLKRIKRGAPGVSSGRNTLRSSECHGLKGSRGFSY